jgi:hypothetical protein
VNQFGTARISTGSKSEQGFASVPFREKPAVQVAVILVAGGLPLCDEMQVQGHNAYRDCNAHGENNDGNQNFRGASPVRVFRDIPVMPGATCALIAEVHGFS